ncbi:MAG: FG-GAP repeat protein [bacterium]|nr:FG-GAP repeat protein [bacterium]
MRTGSLFHKLALACALTLPGGLASACLSFECSATDIACNPAALLLYLRNDPGCNFTQSPNYDALQQEAYIKTSNPDASDGLDGIVAFDCETQTLALGMRSEDSNATGVNGDQLDNSAANAGAVYVFRFQDGQWSQEAYLKGSNTEGGDRFGISVAISGDTLVAGASQEDSTATGVNGSQGDNSAADSGAAYVFRRDSSDTWSQAAYLKASNTEAGDAFGSQVAISGDLIAVSAPGEASGAAGINGIQSDNSAANAGAVYVFRRDSSDAWQQEAYVKPGIPGAADSFGAAIALDGETLAAGAAFEDSSVTGISPEVGDNAAADAGAAYVFTAANGVWSQQAYIKASNANAGDEFGEALALRGDLLAVSTFREASSTTGINGDQSDNSAADAGAAYVFRRSGAVWAQEAYIKASNAEAGEFFGRSVAVGNESLLVGATNEASAATGIGGDQTDNSANGAGGAYLFRATGGLWTQAAYIKASNTELSDQFGKTITMSGDGMAVYANNEDGGTAGINGSQGNGIGNSGAIYFFR